MQLLTACLCDSAADYQGKLCVLGAFDTIHATQLPATHPSCAVALRFVFRESDLGRHHVELSLIDVDGREILPSRIGLDLTVPAIPDRTYFVSSNCVVNLQGVVLPAAGQYSFDVKVDGQILANIPLQVVKAK